MPFCIILHVCSRHLFPFRYGSATPEPYRPPLYGHGIPGDPGTSMRPRRAEGNHSAGPATRTTRNNERTGANSGTRCTRRRNHYRLAIPNTRLENRLQPACLNPVQTEAAPTMSGVVGCLRCAVADRATVRVWFMIPVRGACKVRKPGVAALPSSGSPRAQVMEVDRSVQPALAAG